MIGTRLGPYEITARLGSGGMGEVYRAKDSKLGREVAIKVLPSRLAADSDALARFDREARAVAALSHPNILAIYDFGHQDERAFAVMELLDGETLMERLATGALPARKALEIAAQVASGLAAAHERGLVHRDLKPANLFLTRDGQVKILDFGLARQAEVFDSESQWVAAPTQGPATEVGSVLGTAGYMAPEQVRGLRADHRADIFALGVVLYEMLTGRRAYARDTAAESMTAILRDEPPEIEKLGDSFSPSIARLVQHCLEKRPEERFQSARDLAFDLRSLAAGGSASDRSMKVPAVGAARRTLSRTALGAAAIAALAVAAGWFAATMNRSSDAAPGGAVPRATFRQLTKLPGGEGMPTVAPDGESFVFAKRDGGDADLFLQRLSGSKAIPLTADCELDDTEPAFSLDGRSIAYRSECGGGGIHVMGATGESVRRVADFGYAPAWSPDGNELAVVTEELQGPTSRNSTSTLWAVRVDTGARRKVSEHDAMNPTWSPDGRRIAFWGLREPGFQRDLWSVAADGSQSGPDDAVAILDDPPVDWAPVYSRDGRWLAFASTRGGTFNLWRLALDPASGQPGGLPEPLTAPSSWAGPFAMSADGRRIVFVDRNADTAIVRAPFDAARGVLAAAPQRVFSASYELREQNVSPDGHWIVFANEDLPQHLHLVRSDGTGYRQLTEGEDRNRQGSWSPDGQRILFQTSRGESSIAVIRPDGGGWQALPGAPAFADPLWSPDGTMIAANDYGDHGESIFDVRAGVEAPKRRQLPTPGDGLWFWANAWSPDSTALAGRAIRNGQTERIVIFRLASDDYLSLAVPGEGVPDASMTFVDRARLLTSISGALWLMDLHGGAHKRLHTLPAGQQIENISATRDGRWLTWIERADESDIWLMTLEEAPAPK